MTTSDPPADEHAELGDDPDLAPPLHLSGRAMALVAAGGAVGTAARYGSSELLHPWGAWPAATFTVNLVGAFILGLLLEGLARRGPDVGSRRRLRLLVGTGFCGAFTTYSALALDSDLLLRGGHLGEAVGYGLGTVVLGLAASVAGIWLGGRRAGGSGAVRAVG